jgi:DNA helicase-2/ATP-dependent DNA helicase PcrA
VRGIGTRSLEVLQDAARTWNTSLYAAVPHLSGKPGTVLGHFVRLIEDLRRDTAGLPLPELVDHVLDLSTLRAHYRADREGRERLENLDELLNAASNFLAEARGEASPLTQAGPAAHALLADFLAHASLEAGDHQADQGADAVQLMTVHSAKGLEFNAVFLSGLEEGLFPHENSTLERDGLEEERRLMYVAVTRARERLYLSFAQSRMLHGQTRYNLRSRFLEEIPSELTKWLTPPGPRAGAGTFAGSAYFKTPEPVPRAPRPAFATLPNGLRIGQSVRHAKFGQGIIVAAEGGGADAKVQINFGPAGVKWLLLAVAKLDPV